MIVAVTVVRVVQVPVDEIVDVVAVRDGFVTAPRSVRVPGLVPGASVVGSAALRVVVVDRDHVLVDVVAVDVVQVLSLIHI